MPRSRRNEKQRDIFVTHSYFRSMLCSWSFWSLTNLRDAVLPSVLDVGLTPKLSSLLPLAKEFANKIKPGLLTCRRK